MNSPRISPETLHAPPRSAHSASTTLRAAFAAGALLLAAGQPSRAAAADAATGTGVGIQLGTPSGITLKLPQGRMNSINLVMGYDLDGRHHVEGPGHDHGVGDRFYLGGEYVWYNYDLIRVRKGRLPLYYGPGAFLTLAGHSHAGVSGVVGLEYQFAGAPFDVFFQLGPRLSVFPHTHGDAHGGLGARFFF